MTCICSACRREFYAKLRCVYCSEGCYRQGCREAADAARPAMKHYTERRQKLDHKSPIGSYRP